MNYKNLDRKKRKQILKVVQLSLTPLQLSPPPQQQQFTYYISSSPTCNGLNCLVEMSLRRVKQANPLLP